MSKQLIFRIDDDIKILGDVIMKVRGESQQDVLAQLYINYVIEHAGSIGTIDNNNLLPATYDYVIKRQRADIAPLLKQMEEYQRTKAIEEAKQIEFMNTYTLIKKNKDGIKLLDMLARRLQRDDPYAAISDVLADNYDAMQELFNIAKTLDDNEIVMLCLTLAHIHTTQT